MAESAATQDLEIYKNDFFHQMLEKLIKFKSPDVQFIFEGENGDVEVPAHKELLAVSSPVFEAMFNGELKEKGDVPIVDASVAGFKEFLQFFYSNEVKLTMENIADVLNLTHKYDIAAGFQVAIGFLKKHLTSDKMLWGLELALKYQSDELMAFCKKYIAKDLGNVMNAFEFHDSNGMPISTTNQMLSKDMLARVWNEVFSLTKEAIFNPISIYFLPFYLSENTIYSDIEISAEETIQFDPYEFENDLWLHEIRFANFYEKCGSSYKEIPLKGTISITNDQDDPRFEMEFGMNTNERRIKLPEPILFDACLYHYITIKPSVLGYPSAIVKGTDVNLAFKGKLEICGDPQYTLIDCLYFEESQELE